MKNKDFRSSFLLALRLGLLAFLIVNLAGSRRAKASAVCYVDDSATGANNGSSWADAYTDLKTALLAACNDIWVAAGVYKPGALATDYFQVFAGQTVYGGFNGTESTLSARNPSVNLTILSGDIAGDDLNGGSNIDTTASDISGTNTGTIVVFNGSLTAVTSATLLDGFIITGGDGINGAGLLCYGAGLSSNCSPSLTNLTFEGNRGTGGGAVFLDGETNGYTAPSFTNITFSGNVATSGAGAVFCDGKGGTCNATFLNVTFLNNSAVNSGGAIVNDGSSGGVSDPSFSNVMFDSNNAGGDGGAVFNGGEGGQSSPFFGKVTFRDNTAAGRGGAVADGAHGSGASSPTFQDVTFYGNSSTSSDAGALYNDGDNGGTSSPTLTNVTFSLNSAHLNGGAVFNYGSFGAALPAFSNVILWGDSAVGGPEISNLGATPHIDHSVVQGSGGSGLSWDATLGTDFGGNVDADPKLQALASYGGFTTSTALGAGSSAIDAGTNTGCPGTDQRYIKRPQGARCDIGAFERIPERASLGSGYQTDIGVFRSSTGGWFVKGVLATSYGVAGDDPIPYDFNGDAKSDVAVYRPSTSGWFVQGQFSTLYGLPGDVPVPGDYNGDGKADVAVYRPSTSTWYAKGFFSIPFGLPGDIPVPGDYNGDGMTDIAVYRPSTSAWFVFGAFATIYGLPGDIPVPADYNGDGITDLAVYRPSAHAWFIRNVGATIYGLSGDIPVPGDYNGDSLTDIAVYRPSSSSWFVKNVLSTVYGLTGDYPLPAPDTNADGNPYQ